MSRLKNRTRRTPKKQFLVDHVASEAFAFASVGAALYLLAYKTYSVYLYHLGLGEMIGSFGLSQALRVTVLVASQSLGLLYLTMMISYLIYRPKLFSIIFSNPISMVLAFAFSILFYLEGFSTKVVINFVLLVLSIIVVLIIYRFNEGKRPDEKFELFLEQFSNKSFDSNPHPLSVMILRPIPSFFVDCFLFFLVFLPIVGTFLGTTIASGIHDGKVIQKKTNHFCTSCKKEINTSFQRSTSRTIHGPKYLNGVERYLFCKGKLKELRV